MIQADGGYLTGWNKFPDFKPADGELVIIHNKWWKDYGEPAIYRKKAKMFDLGIRRIRSGKMDEECVDFWMYIPPIPKEDGDI